MQKKFEDLDIKLGHQLKLKSEKSFSRFKRLIRVYYLEQKVGEN